MGEIAACSRARDGLPYMPAFRRQVESLVLAPGDA